MGCRVASGHLDFPQACTCCSHNLRRPDMLFHTLAMHFTSLGGRLAQQLVSDRGLRKSTGGSDTDLSTLPGDSNVRKFLTRSDRQKKTDKPNF